MKTDNQSPEFLIGQIYGMLSTHNDTLKRIEDSINKSDERVTLVEKTNKDLAIITSQTSGILVDIQRKIDAHNLEIQDTKRIVNELLRDKTREQVTKEKNEVIESLTKEKNEAIESSEVEMIKVKSDTWKFVVTSVISFISAVLASVGIKITLSQ